MLAFLVLGFVANFHSNNVLTTQAAANSLSPVVMVPGIAGTGLFAKLDNVVVPACGPKPLTYDWFRIWASLSQMMPPRSHQECWAATLSMLTPQCDPAARNATGGNSFEDAAAGCPLLSEGPGSLYRDRPGTFIRPEGFGRTEGFEFLDYAWGYGVSAANYFQTFVAAFRAAGYTDYKSLFGLPYDWRLPPWQLESPFLKALVELAVTTNHGRKATLVAHSLGAVVVNRFLTESVTAEWKAAHVERFVSINGAFGGSPKTVRAILTGYVDPFTVNMLYLWKMALVPAAVMRSFHRTTGSIYALTPSPEVYGANQKLMAVTRQVADANGNGHHNETAWYTTGNWTEVLPPQQRALVYQARRLQLQSLADPQVPVYCLYSEFDDATTEAVYHYGHGNNFDEQPQREMTRGDETLPLEALTWCRRWPSTSFSMITRNVDHMSVLKDEDFSAAVAALVVNGTAGREHGAVATLGDGEGGGALRGRDSVEVQ